MSSQDYDYSDAAMMEARNEEQQPKDFPFGEYGSLEWIELLRVAVSNAAHADTGAIRNALMRLSQHVNAEFAKAYYLQTGEEL